MDRPALVIRDIHHHGGDLTATEAIGRLSGGGTLTVTVTCPAPRGGDPRNSSDITVRLVLGRQPGLPPQISWEARTSGTPGYAALFAEALTLASQLAAAAGPGGETALSRAAAIGAVHGRDAARRALARAAPAACRDIAARLEAGDPMVYDLYATPSLGGQHGICYEALDLADDLGINPSAEPVLAAAEEAYFTGAGEAFWAEAERIARDRAAAQPPHASSPRSEA